MACPSCGGEIVSPATSCPRCGADVDVAALHTREAFLAGEAVFLAKLLAGEMPPDTETAFAK